MIVCFGLAWVITRQETRAIALSRGLSHPLKQFIPFPKGYPTESNAPSSKDQDRGGIIWEGGMEHGSFSCKQGIPVLQHPTSLPPLLGDYCCTPASVPARKRSQKGLQGGLRIPLSLPGPLTSSSSWGPVATRRWQHCPCSGQVWDFCNQ